LEAFEDQKYINKIREALWIDRQYGRAAVMVGAGFSRNAIPQPGAPPLSTWWDISIALFDQLNPGWKDRSAKERHAKIAEIGHLKLASEYITTFGLPQFDGLLKKMVPDLRYNPGHVHDALLSLPWSDVFTTNYDTLLERTRPNIISRNYELIESISGIPLSMKPRIVKLHGSFPAVKPFIYSEEDYRTYPALYAPFVNMVQQSIMENELVLLGFSGDDPNFLQWTGWVRDNLKEHTPNIYLVGLLQLRESQKNLLRKRKIIPIDLTPLFPKSTWPDHAQRHSNAIHWFLLNLFEGRPSDFRKWPNIHREELNTTLVDPRLPEIPQNSIAVTLKTIKPPIKQWGEPRILQELLKEWKKCREEYPGWVLVPYGGRQQLQSNTLSWCERIIVEVDLLDAPDNLFILRELVWRLRESLSPLMLNWFEKIGEIVQLFNPYPEYVKISGAKYINGRKEHNKYDWDEIGSAWVELVFALAREAREDVDESRFNSWMEILEPLKVLNSVWAAQWYYEKCQYLITIFDYKSAKVNLDLWIDNLELPFWMVHKAAIYISLGEYKEAYSLSKTALDVIRQSQETSNPNYSLYSQEAFTLWQLRALDWKVRDKELKSESWEEMSSRLDFLKQYKCDPAHEFSSIVNQLKTSSKPKPAHETTIKKGFGPGEYIQSSQMNYGSGLGDYSSSSFQLLIGMEKTAFPAWILGYHDSVRIASKRTKNFTPLLSLIALIQSADMKLVKEDQSFSRGAIATWEDETFEFIVSRGFHAIREALNVGKNFSGHHYDLLESADGRSIKVLTAIVARLLFRCSDEWKGKCLALALDLYEQPLFTRHEYTDPINSLMEQAISEATPAQIVSILPRLINRAIEHSQSHSNSDLLDPELHLLNKDNIAETKIERTVELRNQIKDLLLRVASSEYKVRVRAIQITYFLNKMNVLTKTEQKRFIAAVWSKTDLKSKLPLGYSPLKWTLLRLDSKHNNNLRAYLTESSIPPAVNIGDGGNGKKSYSSSFAASDYFDDWVDCTAPKVLISTDKREYRFDWSADEIMGLLENVSPWWESTKQFVSGDIGPSFLGDYKGHSLSMTKHLLKMLTQVVGPRIENLDSSYKERIITLLDDMVQSEVNTFYAVSMELAIEPERIDKLSKKIRAGLIAQDEKTVHDAIFGLFRWIVMSTTSLPPPAPADLLNEWVNIIVSRRAQGLRGALGQITVLIEDLPSAITEDHARHLCVGLEYLLNETTLNSDEISRIQGIPFDHISDYRMWSAQLAYHLYKWFEVKGLDIPDILNKWKEVCEKDVLPEVRSAWK